MPHSAVPAYLDACAILLSPHVPMPAGSAFFGSPTKLFDYMAMEKAIAASRLDRFGVRVLSILYVSVVLLIVGTSITF